MIFSTVTQLAVLALAGLTTASPLRKRDEMIIGYRRVTEEQAKSYNDNGLTFDGMRDEAQIGDGVYTAYDRDVWETFDSDWYCVIRADSDAMNRVSKAWIPQYKDGNEEDEIWFNNDKVDEYIKSLEDSWEASKTIRLAIIDGYEDSDLQLLIPADLVGDSSMGFKVECKQNKDDIENIPVNYDDWQENIKGDRKSSAPEPIVVPPPGKA